MTRLRNFTVLTGLMAVVMVGLGACSSSGPSELDTPEVAWPDGNPGGEFEDDPAVVALREAFVQEAVAWNALDYSDPDLAYRWGMPVLPLDWAESRADAAREEIDRGLSEPEDWTMLGPRPMTVYDVTSSDTTSTISVCTMSALGNVSDDDRRVSLSMYYVEMFDDGSSLIQVSRDNIPDGEAHIEDCKVDKPVRGYFEPEPEPFSGGPGDLKPPAEAEDYGFDNVSAPGRICFNSYGCGPSNDDGSLVLP